MTQQIPPGRAQTRRQPAQQRLGAHGVIRLVALRELTTRLQGKAFRILTLIMLLLIVAMVLVFKFLAGSFGQPATVGVPAADAAVAAPLEQTAQAVGQDITVVTVPDAATGQAKVLDGSLDVLVVPDGDSLNVTVKSELDPGLSNALTVLTRDLALADEIRKLGGIPAAVSAAVAGAAPHLTQLQPPKSFNPERLALGAITGVLIYLTLMTGGQLVAQGVVEEKSSRVVELLLSTVRPWELMVGKVIGIGAIGLLQTVIWGGVGMGLAMALNVLTISISSAVSTVVWLVVWYLLGFILYAFAFAGAGALVSRQEDIAGVTMPVLFFMMAGYIIGISILPSDPTNRLAEVLSIIPVFSPTLMPIRLAMGGVPAWEAILAVVLTVAMIPALAVLTGKIYRNAVIRTGARVSLRQALKAA